MILLSSPSRGTIRARPKSATLHPVLFSFSRIFSGYDNDGNENEVMGMEYSFCLFCHRRRTHLDVTMDESFIMYIRQCGQDLTYKYFDLIVCQPA